MKLQCHSPFLNPYRLLSVWILIMVGVNYSYSQDVGDSLTTMNSYQHYYPDIFKKKYWNFFIRPSITFQNFQRYRYNDFSFNLKPTEGYQFGWNINIGLPKQFSIQIGVNAELSYFDYRITGNLYGQGIMSNNNVKDIVFIGYIVPVYVCYRIPVYNAKRNFFIEPKLGFDVTFGASSSWTDDYYNMNWTTGTITRTVSLDKGEHNPKIGVYRFSASIVIGIGFNFILKNQRVLNVQVMGTYNPFINDYGTVTFMPNSPEAKTIPFRYQYNSLGIEINYLFTKYPKHSSKRKRLQNEYRNLKPEQARF